MGFTLRCNTFIASLSFAAGFSMHVNFHKVKKNRHFPPIKYTFQGQTDSIFAGEVKNAHIAKTSNEENPA